MIFTTQYELDLEKDKLRIAEIFYKNDWQPYPSIDKLELEASVNFLSKSLTLL